MQKVLHFSMTLITQDDIMSCNIQTTTTTTTTTTGKCSNKNRDLSQRHLKYGNKASQGLVYIIIFCIINTVLCIKIIIIIINVIRQN
jgi:hypothetical protein